MTTALELFAVAVIVAANAFFVAAEYGLVTVRRTRVQELEAQGNRGARRVLRLLEWARESSDSRAAIVCNWSNTPQL